MSILSWSIVPRAGGTSPSPAVPYLQPPGRASHTARAQGPSTGSDTALLLGIFSCFSFTTDRKLRQTENTGSDLQRLLASNLCLKTIPGLDLTSPFQEKRQGSDRKKVLSPGYPFLSSPLSLLGEARIQNSLNHGAVLLEIKIFPFLALPILSLSLRQDLAHLRHSGLAWSFI